MSIVRVFSFASGEIAPALHGRVDVAKYSSAVKTLRNFFVMRSGGAASRPGTQMICEVKNSNNLVRQIPFIFNSDQTYLLEFGDRYFRVLHKGLPVTGISKNIASITKGSTTIINSESAHGLANGQLITFNVLGMTDLNGPVYAPNVYQVSYIDPVTFQIANTLGGAINSTLFGDFTSGTYQRIWPIFGISNASPGVVSMYAGTSLGFANGDAVTFIVGGMTQLNNRTLIVSDATSASFKLKTLAGAYVDTTSYGAFTGGSVYPVLTVTTPYAAADLAQLEFVQSVDVITITHSNYPPQLLSRLSENGWKIEAEDRTSKVTQPTLASAAAGTAGSTSYSYQVTAIDKNLEESLPATGSGTPKNVTGVSSFRTIAGRTSGGYYYNYYFDLTIASHGWSVGSWVYLDTFVGPVGLNNRAFRIYAVPTTNTIRLSGDITGYPTYVSGGTASLTTLAISSAVPSSTAPNIISWTPTEYATQYKVYKSLNGVYGFIGLATVTQFLDTNISPDTTDTPPTQRLLFTKTGDYPATVTYYQQRKLYANTVNNPETVWTSRTGQFRNFSTSIPLKSDDAIDFKLAGRQYNKVKHLLDLGGLVLFTDSGEFLAEGDQNGVLKPGSINLKQQSAEGSSSLSPIVIGNTALFVQREGSIIRDLGYEFGSNSYRGVELTVYASHLFDDHQIVAWAFQKIPHSIVWAVRDDGVLLGLTYIREQAMLAWHRHDFENGFVEDVCVIPENNESAVYLVIRRLINGVTKRYIERMGSRGIEDPVDLAFMDSHLTYDGRNTDASLQMTVTGGTLWNETETQTMTHQTFGSASAYFSASDVGNRIVVTGLDGTVIKYQITAFTSSSVVTVRPDRTIPVAMRTTALNNWSKAVAVLNGLDHLEGQTVAVFADGYIVASPHNPNVTNIISVSLGAVTLPDHYSVIHVGLPITSDLETLDIDTAQGETLIDKQKLVNKLLLRVQDSKSIFIGGAAPTGTNYVAGLTEKKLRSSEDPGTPVQLLNGVLTQNIDNSWSSGGNVFIRSVDPVPTTILSIAPSGMLPFKGGG